MLSTAIFHQFLTTMGYQERKLTLRPRNAAARRVFDEECAKGGTHQDSLHHGRWPRIAKGVVNGKQGTAFFLDSGLNEPEAAILLQKEALDYASVNLKGGETWLWMKKPKADLAAVGSA